MEGQIKYQAPQDRESMVMILLQGPLDNMYRPK